MFLISDIYRPAGRTYRITTADMDQHKTWTADIQRRLPAGSKYFLDIGHNGNGNIEAGADLGGNQCGIGPIEYDEQIDTPLEFKKPLGTGKNLWPSTPTTYPYTTTCTNLDPLKVWFAKAANRDVFAHVSHTFTHEDQNNATYFDVSAIVNPDDNNGVKMIFPLHSSTPVSGCQTFPCSNAYNKWDDIATLSTDGRDLVCLLGTVSNERRRGLVARMSREFVTA